MTLVRVLVLDAQPLTGAGIVAQLDSYDHILPHAVVPAATTFDHIADVAPQVVLIHPHSSDTPAIRALYHQVAASDDWMSVLLASAERCADPRVIIEAFETGVDGMLDRDTATINDLVAAVERLAAGQVLWEPCDLRRAYTSREESPNGKHDTATRAAFTPREREIFALIATGVTNVMIAEQLGISERTVQSHVSHIFAKLGVASRAEAIAAYYCLMPETDVRERVVGVG
jgi:DNA-binding NarL/FixJ family response regulator